MDEVYVHAPENVMESDPLINKLVDLTQLLFSISESNYLETWYKIKELGYISEEWHQSLLSRIAFLSQFNYRKIDQYCAILSDLSKQFDIKSYFKQMDNFKMNLNPKILNLVSNESNTHGDANNDLLEDILVNDDIEKLKTYIKEKEDSKNQIFEETCKYGSFNCYNCLITDKKDLKECNSEYDSIIGGNEGIIKSLEERGVEYNKECIKATIISHNPDLFDWLYDKFHDELTEEEILDLCFNHSFIHGIMKFDYFKIDSYCEDICKNDMFEFFTYILTKIEYITDILFRYTFKYGSLRMIKLMYNKHHNKCHSRLRTIYELCCKKRMFVIKFFLENGSDPNVSIFNNKTLLYQSIRNKQEELFKILIKIGNTDLNAGNPLMKAIKKNQTEMAKMLIYESITDLNQSIELFNNYHKAEEQLKKGKDRIISGSPLIVSLILRRIEISKCLIASKKVDVNAHGTYCDRETKLFNSFPLLEALRIGDKEIIEMLLDREDIDVNHVGWTTVVRKTYTAKFSENVFKHCVYNEMTEMIDRLLKIKDFKPFDNLYTFVINSKYEKFTPPSSILYSAAFNGDNEQLEYLLKIPGVLINKVDPYCQMTPLFCALYGIKYKTNANIGTIKILLGHEGINVNMQCLDKSPLEMANSIGDKKIIKLFTDRSDLIQQLEDKQITEFFQVKPVSKRRKKIDK